MKESYKAFYCFVKQKILSKKAFVVDGAKIKSLKNDEKK